MHMRLLTLRFDPACGRFDERELLELGRTTPIVSVREHWFEIGGIPHLACLVTCAPVASHSARRQAEPLATDRHSSEQKPSAAPTASGDGPPGSRAAAPTDIPRAPSPPPATLSPRLGPQHLSPDRRGVYEALRVWRSKTAHEQGVPPYVVLTNKELHAVVVADCPSLGALARIEGIGKKKIERYGRRILAVLGHRVAEGERTVHGRRRSERTAERAHLRVARNDTRSRYGNDGNPRRPAASFGGNTLPHREGADGEGVLATRRSIPAARNSRLRRPRSRSRGR
jgi:hypothetical protein